MFTLNRIGKEAVVKHHKEVPFRLLEPVPELSLPSPSGRGAGGEGATEQHDFGGNFIIQGDNLHTLKMLFCRVTPASGWAWYDNSGGEPVLLDWRSAGE